MLECEIKEEERLYRVGLSNVFRFLQSREIMSNEMMEPGDAAITQRALSVLRCWLDDVERRNRLQQGHSPKFNFRSARNNIQISDADNFMTSKKEPRQDSELNHCTSHNLHLPGKAHARRLGYDFFSCNAGWLSDQEVLKNSRIQVRQGLKRREEEHVRTIFRQHARQLMGRFAPVRPCSCSEQLIHGKEFLRPALEQLKISVRDDHEFEEVYREVNFTSLTCFRTGNATACFPLLMTNRKF